MLISITQIKFKNMTTNLNFRLINLWRIVLKSDYNKNLLLSRNLLFITLFFFSSTNSNYNIIGQENQNIVPTICDTYSENNFVPDFNINSQTNVSFASNYFPDNYYYDKKILIDGILKFNKSIIFVNCIFKFKPNASLEVLNSNSLNAWGSKFFSCNHLWEGIKIESNAIFNFGYGLIQNAKYGITLDDNSVLNSRNSRYLDNFICIRNGNATINSSGPIIEGFSSNIFTSTKGLILPVIDNSNFPNKAYCGIYSNHGIIMLPYIETDGKNKFSNMGYGIRALNSTINVLNCEFNSFFPYEFSDQFSTLNLSPSGIASEQGLTRIGNQIDNNYQGNCHFFNIQGGSGIRTWSSSLSCKNNLFDGDFVYGISSTNNNILSPIIDINFNHLHSTALYAEQIFIDRPSATSSIFFPSHLNISNNSISLNELGQYGMYLGSFLGMAEDEARIFSNKINIVTNLPDQFGVFNFPSFSKNWKFRKNYFYYHGITNEYHRYGFWAVNSKAQGNEFSLNELVGVDDVNGLGIGAKFENCPQWRLCQNIFNNSRIGLHFAGNNSDCTLKMNTFGHHNYGLVVSNNLFNQNENHYTTINSYSLIGPKIQLRHGNMWSEDVGAYQNSAVICSDFPLKSHFVTENEQISILPPTRSPISNDFFEYLMGNNNYGCGLQIQNQINEQEENLNGFYKEQIETNFISFTNMIAKWDAKKDAYYQLLKLSNLNNNSVFNQFLIDELQTSVGILAKLRHKLLNIVLTPEDLQFQYDQLIFQRNQLLDNFYLLPPIYQNQDTLCLYPNLLLLSTKKSIKDQILENQNTTTNIEYFIKEFKKQKAILLLNEITTLDFSSQIEKNELFLIKYNLRRIAGVEESQTENFMLDYIANMCIDSAGRSKEEARMIIQNNNLSHTSFINSNCSFLNQEFRRIQELNSITIYPNPVENIINLIIEDNLPCLWEIINLSGQSLLKGKLNQLNKNRIYAESLSPGIYFLKIIIENQLSNVIKFNKL